MAGITEQYTAEKREYKCVLGDAGQEQERSFFKRMVWLILRRSQRVTARPEEKCLAVMRPSFVERLMAWRRGEPTGKRARVGIWIEPYYNHKIERIDLRLSKTGPVDTPIRASVIKCNCAHPIMWSYGSGDTLFISLHLSGGYWAFPSTSNYIGVIELQWDDAGRHFADSALLAKCKTYSSYGEQEAQIDSLLSLRGE